MRLWLLVHRNADTKHQRASQQMAIKSYLPQCRQSSTSSGVSHTYTCTRSVSRSLYVNKVPLDSLCSPSCFHPICPQNVAPSPGPNTNTCWHDQEQQQWVIVHLMHSWRGGGVDCLHIWRGEGWIKQGNFCNVMKFSMQTRKGSPLIAGFLGDALLKDSPLHHGIRHQMPHNQLC